VPPFLGGGGGGGGLEAKAMKNLEIKTKL